MKRVWITEYVGLSTRLEALAMAFLIEQRWGHEVCLDWHELDALKVDGARRKRRGLFGRLDSAKLRNYTPEAFDALGRHRNIVLRTRILEVQDKAGFVPNVFLSLARRPAEWRAFFAYHDALLLREESGLSKGEREMIITATSAANKCLYCVVAHGAILRVYEKKPLVADQVAVNYRKADITPRQKAMLDFALKVCLDSRSVDDADYAALREHGFTDEDAWDIAGITALFGLSNRMANAVSMRPNDEFYLLGRVPKAKG